MTMLAACLHCNRTTDAPPICAACLAGTRSGAAGILTLPGPRHVWIDQQNGDYTAEENPGALSTTWAELRWWEGERRHEDSAYVLTCPRLDVSVIAGGETESAMLRWCADWLTVRIGARWEQPDRAK